MTHTHTAYIALGANLGDAPQTLKASLTHLAQHPDVTIEAVSSFYRTAPVGLTEQPDFVNAVARLVTRLDPETLLHTLLSIEGMFGRIRQTRNGPRTLDLDLLLYDGLVLEKDNLTLPHPRLHLRAFVLVPLAEIAPDLSLPHRGSVRAWLPAVANQAIHRI